MLDKISKYGITPLPPYIKNENLENEIHYQTFFARKIGAVAAPTAGLHFTKEIIDTLIKKKVLITSITLHVGAGTFLPVKTKNINDHKMHFESYEISKNTVNILKNAKLNGLVIESNKVILVNRNSIIDMLRSYNMFLASVNFLDKDFKC